jgi:hypothetical protein
MSTAEPSVTRPQRQPRLDRPLHPTAVRGVMRAPITSHYCGQTDGNRGRGDREPSAIANPRRSRTLEDREPVMIVNSLVNIAKTLRPPGDIASCGYSLEQSSVTALNSPPWLLKAGRLR